VAKLLVSRRLASDVPDLVDEPHVEPLVRALSQGWWVGAALTFPFHVKQGIQSLHVAGFLRANVFWRVGRYLGVGDFTQKARVSGQAVAPVGEELRAQEN
jgi:hypothetical protein